MDVQALSPTSLKFRSLTPPRVRIAAEQADGFWLFSVPDNGIGLPAGLGDEIFAICKRDMGRSGHPRFRFLTARERSAAPARTPAELKQNDPTLRFGHARHAKTDNRARRRCARNNASMK